MKKKRIMITGARGYIGTVLVKFLVIDGHTVDLFPGRISDIPKKSIDVDIVIHLAFAGGGTEHLKRKDWNDSMQMQNTNIIGFKTLLNGIKNENTKIILLSSSAVYGKFQKSPILSEKAELTPASEYGKHKVFAEEILKKSNFDWMILRPCSVFGPSCNQKLGNSFLNVIIENVIKTGRISMMGGEQKIDTLYIFDLIKLIVRICSGEWYTKEIYNISGEIVTIEDMLNTLSDVFNKIGIHCLISKEEYSKKPDAFMSTKKLKKDFPDWRTTPLNFSLYSLVIAQILSYRSH